MSEEPTAGETFDAWIAAEIGPFLAARRWRRRAGVFERPAGPNTGLIVFRRWKWNDARTCRFFVEVGVYSARLAANEAAALSLVLPRRPTLLIGAVAHRMSELMGERVDLLWTIRAPALSFELDALGANVRDKLASFALPFVEAHLTDELIRDDLLSWLDQLSPGSLRRLRLLLEDLGPCERLRGLDARIASAERELEAARRDLPGPLGATNEEVAAADEAMRRIARR